MNKEIFATLQHPRQEVKARQAELPLQERLSPENFERLGWLALNAAKKVRREAGITGASPATILDKAIFERPDGQVVPEPIRNVYGEQPIRADVLAERAVIKVLQESGIRWRVRSEEHGDLYIYNGTLHREPSPDAQSAPEAFAVLDGIDGSKADHARILRDPDLLNLAVDETRKDGDNEKLSKLAGTMLAFAPTADPKFKDFTYAGMLEHDHGEDPHQGRLVYATQGRGVFVQTPVEFRQVLPPAAPERLEGGDIFSLELDYFTQKGENDALTTNLAHMGVRAGKVLSSGIHYNYLILGEPMPPYAISQPKRIERFRAMMDYHVNPDTNEVEYDEVLNNIAAVIEPERKGYEEFAIAETFMRILYEGREEKEKGVVLTFTDAGKIVDLGELNYLDCVARWFQETRPPVRPIVLSHSPKVAEQLLLATRAQMK